MITNIVLSYIIINVIKAEHKHESENMLRETNMLKPEKSQRGKYEEKYEGFFRKRRELSFSLR